MVLHIYVDGSGSPYFKYGYFIDETGESHMEHLEGISNNEAEYLAIIAALNNVANKDSQIVLLSDSQLVVNQINHKFGINNEKLRRFDLFTKSKLVSLTLRNGNIQCTF